jgi:hypothetical protein
MHKEGESIPSSRVFELERCAGLVVDSIEKVITKIRSIEEFSPRNRKRVLLENVDLVGKLTSQGIFSQVEESITFVEETLKVNLCVEGKLACQDHVPHNNQRSIFLRKILLPLLNALFKCYSFLDDIPQQPIPVDSYGKTSGKPPPPNGMLSLKNYTDIAALIEFTVCATLIPLLDDHIVISIRDRAQYLLPKSLAGRLSRISLLWGSAVPDELSLNEKCRDIKDIIVTMCNVLFLDRFRPMLLPRHLSDLYAGIFQAEKLDSSIHHNHSFHYVYELILPKGQSAAIVHVNPLVQAQALQKLLLQGTKAPIWLRKRVSDILADLAFRDLFAIVQVFVTAASSSQNDMTSAAIRLAKTLALHLDDANFCAEISHSLLKLLDVNVEKMTSIEFSFALCAWAILDQFDEFQIKTHFLPLLTTGISSTAPSFEAHRMIQRLVSLLAVLPSTQNPSSICKLILFPIPSCSTINILHQLIRLASMNVIEHLLIKSQAIFAIQLISNVMERTDFSFQGSKVEGVALLSVSLVRCVEPSQWDLDGYEYCLDLNSTDKHSNELTSVMICKREVLSSHILDDLTVRARFVVQHVINGLQEETAKTERVNFFFRFLLSAIFNFCRKGISKWHTPHFQIIVMTMLTHLCEICTPERILLGSSSDAADMFAIFKVVLDCAVEIIDRDTNLEGENNLIISGYDFDLTLDLLRLIFPVNETKSTEKQDHDRDSDIKDTLLSISSVVLSLLNAVLELGVKTRSVQELVLLESMIPSLQTLSSLASPLDREKDFLKTISEIAEMATHAALLIKAIDPNSEKIENSSDESEASIECVIAQAESKIKMEHPATRAQGVLMLRHLARGYLANRGEKIFRGRMIMDVDSFLEDPDSMIMDEILRISVMSLSDEESYVYMAGIQTIVAIADINPKDMLPKIAKGLCTGMLTFHRESETILKLSQDDRIKLAEALVFIIRRRGDAIEQFSPQILSMMICNHGTVASYEMPSHNKIIQEETHEYFMRDPDEFNELTPASDRLESKSIRLNTGGPVFMSELNDVLRSSCVLVLAETVMSTSPTNLRFHVILLIYYIVNVLRLEKSRALRRAAAYLAVSLYEACIRDYNVNSSECLLIVSMVKANEDLLRSTLEVAMDAERLPKFQLYDPATAARCQEALEIRRHLEEIGIIATTKLRIEIENRMDANARTNLVRRLLSRD